MPPPAPSPSPSPAPAPNPQPDNTSAACFNEADLHEGTTLVAEQELSSSASSGDVFKQRLTTITHGREAFAGVNPVRQVRTQFFYATNTEGTDRQYLDVVDGKVIRYGSRNGGDGSDPKLGYTLNQPAVARPTMAPGETINESYVIVGISGENGEIRNERPVSGTTTYVGCEALETPMGTTNTCKFSSVARIRQLDGSDLTQLQDNWIAADGPYRGQMLKMVTREGETVGTLVVTQITYTPM